MPSKIQEAVFHVICKFRETTNIHCSMFPQYNKPAFDYVDSRIEKAQSSDVIVQTTASRIIVAVKNKEFQNLLS